MVDPAKTLRMLLLTAALAGCATTLPPEENPVFLKLTDLEARLVRLERVIDNQSLIEMTTRVDQLHSEVQGVRAKPRPWHSRPATLQSANATFTWISTVASRNWI